MIKNLDIKDITPLRRYHTFDSNNESVIFKQGIYLHKIPDKFNDKLLDIINLFYKEKMNEIVEVTNLITDQDYNIGYSMINHVNYKSLRKNIYRSINNKIEDSINIINIFKNLGEKGLFYNDFHLGNILLDKNTGNIKVCDLDAFRIRDTYLDMNKKIQLSEAIGLCTAYIYGVDCQNTKILVDAKEQLDEKDIIRDCINSIGSEDFLINVNRLRELNPLDIKSNRGYVKRRGIEEYKAHKDYYRPRY